MKSLRRKLLSAPSYPAYVHATPTSFSFSSRPPPCGAPPPTSSQPSSSTQPPPPGACTFSSEWQREQQRQWDGAHAARAARNRPKPSTSDSRSDFQRASDAADAQWAAGGAYTAQRAGRLEPVPEAPAPAKGVPSLQPMQPTSLQKREQKGWCDETVLEPGKAQAESRAVKGVPPQCQGQGPTLAPTAPRSGPAPEAKPAAGPSAYKYKGRTAPSAEAQATRTTCCEEGVRPVRRSQDFGSRARVQRGQQSQSTAASG